MCTGSNGLHHRISALLEFSAADDVKGFKEAVEEEGHDVNEVGLWYGRRVGSKEVGYEERTPLMIAAMFGSKGVLSFILESGVVDVNKACGSDRATALHCAVVGGSTASPEVIRLLLHASADVSAVDANGNRCYDLIGIVSNSIFNSRKRILEAVLEGREGVDEAGLTFEEADGQMVRQQQLYIDSPRVSKDGTEKKDYHVDLSLPDIKDGMYSTDEFRMYTFKVKPCSRAYSHDWTECPFVHPCENARRRDPVKYQYSCVPCPEFRKGLCSKGDACEYAHGIFECWLHPAQYRTRLCKDESGCMRRVCFFAHKLEELRPLYASTGSALPSPQSYPASASSLDIGLDSRLSLGSPSVLTPPASAPPLIPSGASSTAGGAMWQSPTLQLARSRLKTALNARDFDLDIELFGHENRQQMLLLDEMAGFSPPSKWKSTMAKSPSFPVSLGDDAGELNRLAGVHTNLEDIFGSQLQSPTGIQAHQNVNKQLRGYSSSLSPSNVIGSPSFMVDLSGSASTLSLNSRNAALSKQSQNFIERCVVNHNSELSSPVEPSIFSGWGSPDGKLDWGIRGEELNKMRKSASFGFRATNSPLTLAATKAPPNVDEPDVSWVHSLVKDGPPIESGQYSVEEQRQQPQRYLNNGTDVVPAWLEQLYMEQEQEQMVA
ncbi:hypothetical protein TanjilG_30857 [Lupinus angustifolius]|uniref:C3H1-type domain-containing protein n=1 Tax=Lupinus angustifolius TaxID=3871 RepID=A0A1J7HSX2_LUPAN|nr:PREDICTED: zinc finger CCCH domain-containing protein 66-like [Lupinus angustifolius]OIW09538.1 hypothetical protein TanjilG_30857 [Lupinus angustifolius]